jgi:hypothetical protein
MSRYDDSRVDVDDIRLLDDDTLDRLLLGRIAPDDAPPGFTGVAELVSALVAPATASELAGRDEAVSAAVMIISASAPTLVPAGRSGGTPSRRSATSRFFKTKVASLAFAGTLLGTTGLAAAGVLPDPVQDAAHRILSTVGLDVPTSSDDPQPDADGREQEQRSGETGPDVTGHDGTATVSQSGDDPATDETGSGDGQERPGKVIGPGTEGENEKPGNGNPPDDPGNGNPPDDPGNGNGNPPDDPGNGNPPDNPGNGNGNPSPIA